MKIQASDVSDFYNNNFYKDSRPIPRWAKITIELNDNAMVIPVAQISPSTNFDTLFKDFHSFLLSQGAIEIDNEVEIAPIEQEEPPQPELKHFMQIEHRQNLYLIEEREGDIFHVQRVDNQKIIGADSPMGRTIIKKYKKLHVSPEK